MAFRIQPKSLLRLSSRVTTQPRATSLAPRWSRTYATPTMEQQNRTAIVTGSSRGIGQAIALRLAHDGYDICITDVEANKAGVDDMVSQIKDIGRNAIGVTGDVSRLDEVQRMVQTSVDELGPLNTMVANAGIAQVKALLDLTEQDLKRMFEVNVFGVFNCYSTAAKQMIKQGSGGKLLGAASIVAFKPFALLSHYSASKWAVRGMTQAFAMEMAEHKITVNAYAPGIVGTAMWDLIDEELGKKKGAKKGDTIKKYSSELIALGRTSVPEDVAKTVSYLSSPDSDYMTGQTIVIDGGIIFT
ncbi:acetoin dehydrogenase-like protein [Lophiotrema nucula]|uniref:Acetoin dehydrogenase-like protein n=1 Tax=Lophiotrema nucula TaxID=690887 RepID=A0A6A5YS94_9PLEO|nr:acetoin dehydrogenase-like protein [Lophiotrema nucula]